MDLRSSESFANDSTVAKASFPVAGGNPTTSAAATSGTINYDAAARSYTLSAEGRTLTFLPADIDAAQTTATLTVYKKVAGSTTDTLTLTKPGTEGRFTYTYVGGRVLAAHGAGSNRDLRLVRCLRLRHEDAERGRPAHGPRRIWRRPDRRRGVQ
jgi:hypothetical protein